MLPLKITRVGSSAGLVLTEEALAHLNVQQGDILSLTEAPGGGYRITRPIRTSNASSGSPSR